MKITRVKRIVILDAESDEGGPGDRGSRFKLQKTVAESTSTTIEILDLHARSSLGVKDDRLFLFSIMASIDS